MRRDRRSATPNPPGNPDEKPAAPEAGRSRGSQPPEGRDAFLRVTEIFHSVQGESTWVGLPCTFVRLTGCPLRCVWCDTAYAFHGGERMTLDAIVAEVAEMSGAREPGRAGNPGGPTTPGALVEITGGEPLVHPNAVVLARRLLDEGYTVLVETSGALDVSELDPRVHKIMDLKCPGSGEASRNLWTNLEHLTERDEVKFVVAGREDWRWTASTIRERGLDRLVREGRLKALLVSPVWGEVNLEELAGWLLSSGLPVRLQLQLHKLVWGADRRGV